MSVASAEKTDLRLGFIALTDCAPLVVAREQGFFDQPTLQQLLLTQVS